MAEGQDARLPDAFGLGDEGDLWLARAREARAGQPLGAVEGYELLEEVGRGAQGVVYRARGPNGEEVALKRLVHGLGAGERARLRLARELRAAAALDHPGIVKVRGLAQLAGQPVLVMDWVDGVAATRWSARPGLALDELLACFEQIVEAVAHAHARGVLHRDIKPSNVLVDREGRPRVLDLGLARLQDDEGEVGGSMTRTAAFLGTLGHAAPEQIDGPLAAIDERADVYALGVLLYEMLTGERPYPAARNLAQALDAFAREAPARPSVLDPRCDRRLDAVLLQALRIDRERRYPTAEALLADVRRWRRGEPVRARPPGPAYGLRRWSRRHPVSAAVTLALAVAGLAWGVHAGVQGARLREERDRARQALEVAQIQRAIREEVLGFLLDDVLGGGGAVGEATVAELLDHAAARVGPRLRGRPSVEAAVREALGCAFFAQGEFLAAEAQFALAVEFAAAATDADPLLLARCRTARGTALLWLQRARDADAEAGLALASLAEEPRAPELLHAAVLALQARCHVWFGRFAQALSTARQGLAALGTAAHETPAARAAVVELLSARVEARLALSRDPGGASSAEQLAAAEADLERALDLALFDHPEDHPVRTGLVLLLGELRLAEGRLAEASAAFQHVDHTRARQLGEHDPRRAPALVGLARTHLARAEPARALAFGAAARELLEREGLWAHRDHLEAEEAEALALAALGRGEEARAGLDALRTGARALLGGEHPEVQRVDRLLRELAGAIGAGVLGGSVSTASPQDQ